MKGRIEARVEGHCDLPVTPTLTSQGHSKLPLRIRLSGPFITFDCR